MIKIKKLFIDTIFPILSAVVLVGGLAYAWTEPTSAPPGGNVAAPLNVGNLGQSKEGGLILNTLGAATGLIVDQGIVGMGTQSPNTAKGTTGYVDAKDVYLRDTGKWASEGGSGGLYYTYYCFSDSGKGTPVCANSGGDQGYCPAGFKQEMALGNWGFCYMSPGYPYVIYWFLPPGGHCGTGSWTPGNIYGSAYVCSKI